MKKKKKRTLKLYVWTQYMPDCFDWSDGLAFAIAASEKSAKKMIVKSLGFDPGSSFGTLTVRPLSKPFAAQVCGGQ